MLLVAMFALNMHIYGKWKYDSVKTIIPNMLCVFSVETIHDQQRRRRPSPTPQRQDRIAFEPNYGRVLRAMQAHPLTSFLGGLTHAHTLTHKLLERELVQHILRYAIAAAFDVRTNTAHSQPKTT